ncbi:hypothetical protein PBY51_017998 [Eleginops maclovinus]|uniref:Uncharacterized protein n=1 Tax=Eleginops maclovinus TaxID=56733 RepID=A0AAN7XKG5_ELEMC|nr:hypothetical protein PBY51_017998 [Eleginops maclovinus]
MQLCSTSGVPRVPGESCQCLSGSKASVISAEPRSLIPGLTVLHAARPQLCLCSSIFIWDHVGTLVLSIGLSASTSFIHHLVKSK